MKLMMLLVGVMGDDFGCGTSSTLYEWRDSSFGIGTTAPTSEEYYKNGENRCWFLEGETSVTAMTIVLTKFHSEYKRDFLYIYDVSQTPAKELKKLSGELVSPYVVRVNSNKVMVHFKADDAIHADPVTLQLGFQATFFDSSDGTCVNNCNGGDHGVCDDGLCDCKDEWGPDGTTDCSVGTELLHVDEQYDIMDLGIGEWKYFKFTLEQRSSFLVELVDVGDVDSDPRLMLAADTVPTLSHYYYNYNDWFNWYYDNTDIHFLRGDLAAGTYWVGVTNDVFRATEPMKARLTLRTETPGTYPCLLDCNGHGTCKKNGNCNCDDSWAGSVVNAPDTCQYLIRPVEFDSMYESTVRIGNWDYYELPEITETDVEKGHSLFVEFASYSPHSYPLILIRRNQIPRLWEGYLPTYDAFDFDFGDREGFELVNGQRMSIYVNSTELTPGIYYVGVYNIWGHNGAGEYNSHDQCTYTFSSSLFSAGHPCPSTKNGFCDGLPGACDFNTGECTCPEDRLWRDCSFAATPLIKDGDTIKRENVAVDDIEYFLVTIDPADIVSKFNLVVTVFSSSDGVVPMLLARFGDLPFPNDLATFDDHDLLSNFYGDLKHEILIDAEELAMHGAGQWYFAVLNPEKSESAMTYQIYARFMEFVNCPSHHENMGGHGVGDECSSAGTCIQELGRCDCNDGSVLDDCSADGVFAMAPNSYFPADYYDDETTTPPPIAPDDWVYFSVVVGCEDRELRVYFTTSNDGAIPFLVVRRGSLPLMVQGTYDYWDYYDGENGHEPTQLVFVTACGDDVWGCGEDTCCVTPHYPGTTFATGAPEPGVYYIGVYNDAAASQTISDYVLRVDVDANFQAPDTTEGGCPTKDEGDDACAMGFLGDKCLETCPGVAPMDVYSNSPTGKQQVCSGRGNCRFVEETNDQGVTVTSSVCDCAGEYVGDECELPCPMAPTPEDQSVMAVCGGHGKCSMTTDFGTKLASPMCLCDEGYGGPTCLLFCDGGCGDHGHCNYHYNPGCECDGGYVGDKCDFLCPGLVDLGDPAATTDVCSGNGICTLVHAYDGSPLRANCECDDDFYGPACDLTCPRGIDPATGDTVDCSGQGLCVANDRGDFAVCECYTGFYGDGCEQSITISDNDDVNSTFKYPGTLLPPSTGGTSKKSSDGGLSQAATAGLAVTAFALLGLAAAAWFLAERRKREITRYERLVREVGATSSTVITAAGSSARRSDDVETEKQKVGDYTAPTDVGGVPLPDFKQMRDVPNTVSPFHHERVEL